MIVSILMPYRNTEAFLTDCLDTVRKQTFTNWELLAVDDHSSDGSEELVHNAAASDPRIRPLSNAGKGIIPALRTAYQASQGELVTRMDSDDRMSSRRLEIMSGQLALSGTGHLALGLVKYFSDRGISDGYSRYEAWLNRLTRKGENFLEIYKECAIPSPCWMAWREDLDKCGAFGPDRYPEDYDLAFRFYRGGLKCIPSDQTLLYWRDYDERTSRNSEHYAQNYFLDIKVHYFLELDRDSNRPLVLWGAGFKGKSVARILHKRGVPFRWVCDNPNKIGKEIYGQLMERYNIIDGLKNPQSIITVANEDSQASIRQFMKLRRLQSGLDYFFFC